MLPTMCDQPACMNIAVRIVIQCRPAAMSAGMTDQRSTKASPPSSSRTKTSAFTPTMAAVTAGQLVGRGVAARCDLGCPALDLPDRCARCAEVARVRLVEPGVRMGRERAEHGVFGGSQRRIVSGRRDEEYRNPGVHAPHGLELIHGAVGIEPTQVARGRARDRVHAPGVLEVLEARLLVRLAGGDELPSAGYRVAELLPVRGASGVAAGRDRDDPVDRE